MPTIMGLMHTKSFNDSDRRPLNWREMILYNEPNGSAPLTALLALQKGESTDDPEFRFWTQTLANQSGAITGVYTDALSTAYNPANAGACAAAGTNIWLKMAEADVVHFKAGHTVLIRDTAWSSLGIGIMARILAVTKNGANSFIKVALLQADTWHTSSGYIEGGRTSPSSSLIAWVAGSSFAEGSGPPAAIVYEPTKNFNFTQIFKYKLAMTRTARKTRLRTGDHVKQAKTEALKMHSIEMEKGFIFGYRTEQTDTDTGTPIRTTAGILNYLDKDGNRLVTRDTFAGDWTSTGATGPWAWLFGQDGILEQVFRYGSQTRIAFCGSTAISALNQMAQQHGQLQMTVEQTTIGMKFNKLVCPFGEILLKNHPLFSMEPSMRKSMLVLDPDNLIYRYVDDTFYEDEIQANGLDSNESQYITEAGLELHFPETFRYLENVGG